jgi:hypothetical protein
MPVSQRCNSSASFWLLWITHLSIQIWSKSDDSHNDSMQGFRLSLCWVYKPKFGRLTFEQEWIILVMKMEYGISSSFTHTQTHTLTLRERETETDRETETERQRKTERQTETETDRQRDRDTEKDTKTDRDRKTERQRCEHTYTHRDTQRQTFVLLNCTSCYWCLCGSLNMLGSWCGTIRKCSHIGVGVSLWVWALRP